MSEKLSGNPAFLTVTDKTLIRPCAHVGGQWVEGDDGRRFSVADPATGFRLVDVACLSSAQSSAAVDTA